MGGTLHQEGFCLSETSWRETPAVLAKQAVFGTEYSPGAKDAITHASKMSTNLFIKARQKIKPSNARIPSRMFKLSTILIAVLILATTALSSAMTIVPAGEIFAKVENNQPINYSNISVIGNLDISALRTPFVCSEFIITNSIINNASFNSVSFEKDVILWGTSFGNASFDEAHFIGQADFANTSFQQASFTGASFEQPVTFDGALFQDNVSFEDAKFQKDASLNEVRFLGNADFNYSRFGYYTYFTSTQFFQDALFSDVDFSGVADFSSARVDSTANFFESKFNAAASFSNSFFSGPAKFGLCKFSGISSFGETVFSNEANFNLARFSDAANFSGAKFLAKALFGLAKFEDIVSFQDAIFEGDVNFKGGTISTILLEKAIYGKGSRIILNDTEFSRLKADWTEINNHVVWNPGAYLALVNNYHSLGWSRDEDDCYYQYRLLNQADKEWGWSKAIDVLAWTSCGYGVRPDYAVAWALLSIFFFALIFWRGDGIRRSAKPLHEPIDEDTLPEHVTFRNALFFSTMVFLSQGPIDFLPVGRHRYYVILEGILGWLLLALFLVTLGRVMIR
jgi:uncharacterized protein YjbI with pentapeptide repeats